MSDTQSTTLARLRAKTDRQLATIVDAALERGLALVRGQANGNWAQAEQAHAEAAKLLPLVYELSDPERHRFNSRLAELRSALEAGVANCKHFSEGRRFCATPFDL